MKKHNPFERKYVEKTLFGKYMPQAEDKRRCRTFLRKMARNIEHGYCIGYKAGLEGESLIPWESLQQDTGDSPMGRDMHYRAYAAYCSGHKAGRQARKGA